MIPSLVDQRNVSKRAERDRCGEKLLSMDLILPWATMQLTACVLMDSRRHFLVHDAA